MSNQNGAGGRDRDFSEYFVARSDKMRTTAYLLCGDWQRAEDLTQIAFTKLYLAWDRVNQHELLDRYLRKTIVRTFLDDRRRAWWRRERLTDTPKELGCPQDLHHEDRLVLLQALGKVAPRQRAVLILRYWEDLSIDDTAALLGCSPGTVKSQAARGLQAIREVLGVKVGEVLDAKVGME